MCVKPLDFKSILEEIKPYIREEQHLVSIAGTVPIRDMENTVSCKISKVMPTIVSEVNGGITLVCHNRNEMFDATLEKRRVISEKVRRMM